MILLAAFALGVIVGLARRKPAETDRIIVLIAIDDDEGLPAADRPAAGSGEGSQVPPH